MISPFDLIGSRDETKALHPFSMRALPDLEIARATTFYLAPFFADIDA
jgi:hypothetical protein